MSSKSNYLEDIILNVVLKGDSYTPPVAIYVGLHTDNPGEDGTANELSGGNYERRPMTFGSVSGGSVQNNAAVTFPQASSSWGVITHFSLWDYDSDPSNCLYYGALSLPKTVGATDIFEFLAGGITVTET
jgi:hypothetical protein